MLNYEMTYMMSLSNGNIFRVTGHLCGEFTGPRCRCCMLLRKQDNICIFDAGGRNSSSWNARVRSTNRILSGYWWHGDARSQGISSRDIDRDLPEYSDLGTRTVILTHWGRGKMDAISQTTFSSAFSWMKMLEFRLRNHWNLFLSF